MSKISDKKLITGLDIGTSKIMIVIAEITNDNKIKVIGFGTSPSNGLERGVVVNIESTVKAIKKALKDAEHMADCRIDSVCVGIAGNHIRSFNSNGIIAIRNQEVSEIDVNRVLEAAKAVVIPSDQKILHVLPQEFIIDNQKGIKEPISMSGVRLEVKVHMISGSISAIKNIIKCLYKSNLKASYIVLEQLASSYSVLIEDEKELGVCLVDIGGGTTDISIFIKGAICHTANLGIAGNQVTNDIAYALRISKKYAEKIKIEHGLALTRLSEENKSIELKGIGGRKYSSHSNHQLTINSLSIIIEARYSELFNLIKENLKESGFINQINSGIVLTGGASKIHGSIELAEEIFCTSVRLGFPNEITGLTDIIKNPIHSTGIGLLLYSNKQKKDLQQLRKPITNNTIKIWKRIKDWFSQYF